MWDYKGPFPACRRRAANKKYSWNKKLTAKQNKALHAYRTKYLIERVGLGEVGQACEATVQAIQVMGLLVYPLHARCKV